MVVYRQNLTNILHNSVIMQSLLRIRKKKSSLGGILHISAKLQGYLQNVMLTNRRIWRRR